MCKYFSAIVLLVFLAFAAAATPPKGDKTGIVFFEGSWKEALQKAKDEHKAIFLDISASWCGPCKLLKKKTFTNTKVAEYFNINFINLSVDGEVGEGQMLADKFRIQAYPALFIVDDKGQVMNFIMGYQTPKELLHFAENLARRKE